MANNPKAPGAGGSTSFRYDEVDAACQLFDALYLGKDPKVLLRSREVGLVYGKFKRMKERLDKAKREAGE